MPREKTLSSFSPHKDLNYHHLYYFREIARSGSIAKAAGNLFIGESGLSMQLRALEESLGHKLFERNKHRLEITEIGRIALDYVNRIFSLGDELKEVVQRKTVERRPMLRLGVVGEIPHRIVVEMIAATRKIGECTVTVVEDVATVLLASLQRNELDLVLSVTAPSVNQVGEFACRSVLRSSVAIYGAKKYSELVEGFPHSLCKQPLVMPPGRSRLREELNGYFREYGIEVDLIAETQDYSLQKRLCLDGSALLCFPEKLVRGLLRGEKLQCLGGLDGIFWEIWLVSNSGVLENPFAQRLMREFRVRLT